MIETWYRKYVYLDNCRECNQTAVIRKVLIITLAPNHSTIDAPPPTREIIQHSFPRAFSLHLLVHSIS